MQRVSRLKFVILATIACVILFCIAAFSVSMAKWEGGSETPTKTAQGNASNFYFEYPQYTTSGGVAIPALEANKYYLQVQKSGGVSDYYKMSSNPGNSAEVMIKYVYIKKDTVLDVFKGTAQESIKIKNSDAAAEFEHSGTDDEPVEATAKVAKTGYYDFYYNTDARKMYVSFTTGAAVSTVAPERDTSKESVKVKFTDGTVVFKLNSTLGDTTYFHIWKEGDQGTNWPGLAMNKDTDDTWAVIAEGSDMTGSNSIEFDFKCSEVTGIILNNNSIQTGDNTVFFGAMFPGRLQANYTYTLSPTVVHWNDLTGAKEWDGNKLSDYFSVTSKAPQTSTSGGTTTVITAAKPATTGATSFTVGEQKPNTEVETVRVMNATMQEKTVDGKTTYEYSNYICVSRPNSDDSADDNSLAIIEFEIEGTNLSSVPVSSITLKRRDTDDEGNPSSNYVDTSPRIYNYDPTSPVTLDKIGHGDLHETFDDVDAQGKDTTHMIKHFDDGMYVVIYFADKKQQYFALDMIIETESSAEFTLTAQINNTNRWDRYETGFGEEWGYYLGGLINDVWLWHPTRTTKFTTDEGAVVYDKAAELTAMELTETSAPAVTGKPEQFKLVDKDGKGWNELSVEERNAKLDKVNSSNAFNYYIADYSDNGIKLDENGYPMWARYTKDYVDISLTINLTKGSKVKLSMLDWSGERGDIGNGLMRPTTYYLPNIIHALPDTLFAGADNYDKDLNFVIPETGEYSFRFVGYVHNYVGKWMKRSNGEIYKDASGNPSSTAPDNSSLYTQIPQYNFVIDELYISHSATVGETFTVTFDAGEGGSFATGTVTEQKVRFGNMINWSVGMAPQKETQIIAPADKEFDGWYYLRKNSNGTETAVDYDEGDPVRGDMTLYVKWKGMAYNVTFKGNGGTWGADAEKSITTGNDGKIANANLPAKPVRDGWALVGWKYDNGTVITHESLAGVIFKADTTLIAQWKQLFTVTYYNNYPDASSDTVFTKQENVKDGDTITAPTTTPEYTGYTFNGKWYKDADRTTEWNFTTDTVKANIDLYAGWEIKTYSVTFNLNGVSGTAPTHDDVEYGGKITQPSNPSNADYTFMGWYKDNANVYANLYDFDSEVTSDVTLYAKWMPHSIQTSSYYLVGAPNWAIQAQYYIGRTSNFNGGFIKITFPAADMDGTSFRIVPSKATVDTVPSWTNAYGYEQLTEESKELCNPGSNDNNITIKNPGTYIIYFDGTNIEIYQVPIGSVTVTFDANGGSVTPISAKTDKDTGKLASLPTPTRDGYHFDGWYTVQDNSPAESTKVTADTVFYEGTTVYAKWQYIVTFIAGEGASWDDGNTKDMYVDIGGTASSIAAPDNAPDGKMFDYWADDDGNKFDVANTTIDKSITLHAVWKTRNTNKVYITLNVSNWPGYDYDSAYTYRVHINGASTGHVMTWIGNSKFYVELDKTNITSLTFIQYQKNSAVELSRYNVPNATLTDGEFEGGPSVMTDVTIEGTNQIGLWLEDGIVILNAAYNPDWATNRPKYIYMWGDGVEPFGAWSGGLIDYGHFIKAEKGNLANVVGVILHTDATRVDIDLSITLENGKIYNIKAGEFAEKVQYTVTFDANGGKWADGTTEQGQSIDQDGNATKPYDPEQVGYRFAGWYNGDTAWDFDNGTVSRNITLTAKWVELVTVTFFLNDGSGDVPAQTIDKGGKVTKPADPTKSNNRFVGWYNGDTVWDFDNDKVSGDITLTATWVEVVTVTFNLNGGSGDVPEKIIIDKGMNVTKPEHDPSKAGYSFVCWSATNSTSGSAEFDFGTAINENITLYAQWEENATPQFTVTFNLNGGSGSASEQIVNQGEKAKKPATNPSKVGYSFVCWSATNSMSGGAEFDFNNTAINENIMLYAQWEKTLYKITFVNKDGTVVGTLTADENDTLSGQNLLTATQPDGDWQWVGWRTGTASAMSANGDLIDTDYTFTGDTYVWADWIELFTITFDVNTANGGSGSNTVYSGMKAGDTISVPANPSPSSDLYKFDGWYNKATGGTKYTTIPTVVGSSSVTYYAHYKAVKFRIVIDVSRWNGTTGYSYHIHAWKDGGDTVTGTGSDRWDTRNELNRIAGTNQYYIDFDSSGTIITDIIFTQDNLGTCTEHARKQLKTSDISSNGSFELGNIYTVQVKEAVETATNIGSSGVWLVGGGIQNGGWAIGVEIPNGGAAIVKVTSASGWLKIRNGGTSDGSGTNNCEGDLNQNSDGNFYVSQAGYYKFTWDSTNKKVKAEFLGASL